MRNKLLYIGACFFMALGGFLLGNSDLIITKIIALLSIYISGVMIGMYRSVK